MILPYNNIFPRIAKTAFVVQNADIIGDVVMGEYSSVWFGALVQGSDSTSTTT